MQDVESRKMTFLFARFHILGLFAKNSKSQIAEILKRMERQKEEVGSFYWAFGDIGFSEHNGHKAFFGRLGKSLTAKFETIYDESKHSYTKEMVAINSAYYSNFFILPEFNTIAFEEKYQISKNQFINYFAKFWKRHSESNIEFEFIKDESQALQTIRSWDLVKRAKFSLSPTNPASREDFLKLDEFIKKSKAKKAKLEFRNDETGLSFDKESPAAEGLAMASFGYGDYIIGGTKNNIGQTIKSNSLLIRKDLVFIDNLEPLSVEVLKEIRQIMESMND